MIGEDMAEDSNMSPPDWSDVHHVLVIMAHPDDPDFKNPSKFLFVLFVTLFNSNIHCHTLSNAPL